MPFIGDGDIAAGLDLKEAGPEAGGGAHNKAAYPGLYSDRMVYGADLDEGRVAVARTRLPGADIRVADCDAWPFKGSSTGPIAVADFDAWTDPYASFRAFWASAEKADRLVLLFTDAHRMGVMVEGMLIGPDGEHRPMADLRERRSTFNFYLSKHIFPWFDELIAGDGYRVLDRQRYLRGMLTYWGAAIDR